MIAEAGAGSPRTEYHQRDPRQGGRHGRSERRPAGGCAATSTSTWGAPGWPSGP